MRIAKVFVALAATTLILAACANQKEPAEKAVAQVDSALAEFRADAEKYASEELKGVDESVTKLKANLTSKDYSAVVMGAPSVASAVTTLKETVTQKKADAEAVIAAAQAEWTDLSAKVPPLVAAVQTKMDALVKSKKLPPNVDKAAFETLKADFESVKTTWTDAAAQFASGAAGEAVRKARDAKAHLESIVKTLDITA